MASIKEYPGGKWRAAVFIKGIRKTKVFLAKADAKKWAAQTESDIHAQKAGEIPNKTFADLLEKYRDEVSITKRGEKWERARIGLTLRDEIAKVNLRDINASHIAGWRDKRLKSVTAGSVRREWNLLSSCFNVAVKEWKWLKENPMKEVKRPSEPPARDRIATDGEIERLLFSCGYDKNSHPITATAKIGAAILFAIETAMRAGEIAGLKWDDLRLEQKHCKIGIGKTAAAKRDVPLSTEAIRIIEQLRFGTLGKTVFCLTSSQIDALFRKVKAKALIEDLHFHDLRHTAITRLASKLDILSLARMVGHRDLRMLQVYFNPDAESLADKLD